ncbi:DUF6884 domain-containing protein [Salibacterium halotolerans]|uniref:DUF6884 domain-containing protein n=1 Tax=Salibacterium halotolerans TaxID=1884432 RepID=A0A1I5RJF5_9BACI|nr:DUF6884 domain-containing protein [Salibacterium halotolerans]SFP58662.1 hypothetical protein SAMN05518683_10769 [Salibacterium halotolerans]
MTMLCIIPCGKKKIWDMDPAAGCVYAKDAYQGTLHKKCRKYAEAHGWDWTVLSARHGFLLPLDIVPENYDTGFHFPKDQVIDDKTLTQQWHDKSLDDTDTIVLLTGKKHENVLLRVLPHPKQYEWQKPLQGCRGIGDMLRRLDFLS